MPEETARPEKLFRMPFLPFFIPCTIQKTVAVDQSCCRRIKFGGILMTPMKSLRLALGELLAADVDTLAPVAANKIRLINQNFALTENLVFADLSWATFTGSTAKAGAAGAQQAGTDPLTGDQVVTILAPVGGWRWECTADPTEPETIYGYGLINDAGDTLLGALLFDTPYSINEAGDFIDLGSVTLVFVRVPMS